MNRLTPRFGASLLDLLPLVILGEVEAHRPCPARVLASPQPLAEASHWVLHMPCDDRRSRDREAVGAIIGVKCNEETAQE